MLTVCAWSTSDMQQIAGCYGMRHKCEACMQGPVRSSSAASAIPKLPLKQAARQPRPPVMLAPKPRASPKSSAIPRPPSGAGPRPPSSQGNIDQQGIQQQPELRASHGIHSQAGSEGKVAKIPEAAQTAGTHSTLSPDPASSRVSSSAAHAQRAAPDLPSPLSAEQQALSSSQLAQKLLSPAGEERGSKGALQALIDRAQKLQAAMDTVLTPQHRC